MINQITQQQTKSDSKRKTIASLILSIISIIGSAIVFASYVSFNFPPFWKNIVFQSYIMGWIVFIFLMFGGIFPIVGLILGVLGLKSKEKTPAIVGTIFSLIAIGLYIYILLLAIRIGTG